MNDIILFGYPQSTYVRTARMVCEEKRAPYSIDNDFAPQHPFRKMPALRHGDVALFETLSIADYVDRAFDGPALQPSDAIARAHMLQWISAINDAVYRDVVHGDDVEQARGRLTVLDAALAERDTLVGTEVTLADLFLAPIVAYAGTRDIGPAMLDGFDHLARAHARIAKRDSFTRTAT